MLNGHPCYHYDCEVRMTTARNVACLLHWRVLPKGLKKKINHHLQGCYDGRSNLTNLQVQLDKATRVWKELDDGGTENRSPEDGASPEGVPLHD